MSRSHSTAIAVAVALICYANAAAQEFVYPGQAKSERDLSTCEPYEICSVVHKRYWFANKIERLCRCDGQECPSSWSDFADDDNYTMTLNNRAQMKFCESVSVLPNCLTAAPAANTNAISDGNATTSTSTSTSTGTDRFLTVINETRVEIVNNSTVKNYKLSSKARCYCPSRYVWIAHAFHKNQSATGTGTGTGSGSTATVTSTWKSYRCSELTKCKADDTCGFERTDFYSNYYKCSCPYDHICIRENHSVTYQVNEVLYDGAAFVTNCRKKKTIQEIYATGRPV